MKKEELSEIKKDLLRVLRIGKANAITAASLNGILGLPGGITSEVLRRDVIKPMIEIDHIPIGSNAKDGPKGYYIIETKEELEENLDNLDERIRGMENRKRGMTTGFRKHRGKKPKVGDLI